MPLLLFLIACDNRTPSEKMKDMLDESKKYNNDSLDSAVKANEVKDSIMLSKLSPKKRKALLAKREKERIAKEEADAEAAMTPKDKGLRDVRKNTQVIEAFITSADVLYVSVINTGKDYNIFAKYMCNIMSANGFKPFKVRIREAGTIGHPDADTYGVPLGEWSCQ